jgi:hypothetical protein
MGLSLHVGLSQTALFDQKLFLDNKNTMNPDSGRSDRGVNYLSIRGVPLSTTINVPVGSDGRAGQESKPTQGQFKGVITYGAVSLPYNKYYKPSGDLRVKAIEIALSGGKLESNASKLDWPRTKKGDDSTELFLRAQIGAPYMMRSISFLFGSVITPPLFKFENGNRVELKSVQEARNYWAAEPVAPVRFYAKEKSTNEVIEESASKTEAELLNWFKEQDDIDFDTDNYESNSHEIVKKSLESLDYDYYYSPHSKKVYSIKPGRIDITWRSALQESKPSDSDLTDYHEIAGNYFRKYGTNYLISGASVKNTRKVYWTEETFRSTAPLISIPAGRVGLINFVYNNDSFPKTVDEAYVAPGQAVNSLDRTNQWNLRTIWVSPDDGNIHAYNHEGRIFTEILGDITAGETRTQLGVEIIDVVKRATPQDVEIYLGNPLEPPASARSEALLSPEPILSDLTKDFAYQFGQVGAETYTLYAAQETRNLNDYQVYWMEQGIAGIKWPAALARYKLSWPTDTADYSHYMRPEVANASEAEGTAVVLHPENGPVISWQDTDQSGQPRGFLTAESKFYTHLDSSFPVHRTLLRYTSERGVAFERVFSWLDVVWKDPGSKVATQLKTDTFSWANLKTETGGRVGPGEDLNSVLNIWNDEGSVLADRSVFEQPRLPAVKAIKVGERIKSPENDLAGYVNQDVGTDFSVTAYKNPFEVGFDEAASGAIIPVNVPQAPENPAVHLEVQWFRESKMEEELGFKSIYWPSIISRYTIGWPSDTSSKIILASNDGSGPLESLKAKGTIYTQNDADQPGYNPNEEHALMLGGQVYALRDDLNIVSGKDYSSSPYVLLEYTDSDGRSDMEVYKVVREEGDIRFDYTVEAGTILQAPMPLPLMPKPTGPKISGFPARSLNAPTGYWVALEQTNSEQTINSVSFANKITLKLNQPPFKSLDDMFLQRVSTGTTELPGAALPFFVTEIDRTAKTASGYLHGGSPYRISNIDTLDAGTALEMELSISETAGLAIGDPVILADASSGVGEFGFLASIEFIGDNFIQIRLENPGVDDVPIYNDFDDPNISDETLFSLTDKERNKVILAGVQTLIHSLKNPADLSGPENSELRLTYSPVSLTNQDRADFNAGFTFQDRKGDVWVYRGPHTTAEDPRFLMQFYYKTLPGFYFPTLSKANQPPLGTITPYLRPKAPDGSFVGEAVFGHTGSFKDNDGLPAADRNAQGVLYRPAWPKTAPVMLMAETLTMPKRGLPAIRGHQSLEVLYQQSTQQSGAGSSNKTVVLHDPTRAKKFFLGGEDDSFLNKIPDSVKTSTYRGKTYFPDLPPHLSERFFLDPNEGEHGALVFVGQFVDAALGDDYLMLNVIEGKDMENLKDLYSGDNRLKTQWDDAILGMKTTLELFEENRAKPGTFIPTFPEVIRGESLAEIRDDDVAVDSYALTATGPGTGYVTVLAGNGFNTDVQSPDEPVQMQILCVDKRLYPGELKVIQSSNPLAEKLTLQQVVDLAGKIDDFEFEWKIAPSLGGDPPAVYKKVPTEIIGDFGNWSHVPFPRSGDMILASREAGISAARTSPLSFPKMVGISVIDCVADQGLLVVRVDLDDPSKPKLEFSLSSDIQVIPHVGQPLTILLEDGSEVNGTVHRLWDEPSGVSKLSLAFDAGTTFNNAVPKITQLYEGVSADLPQSIAFRRFTLPAGDYGNFYLSLNLDSALGAKVYIDGSFVVAANMLDASENTPTSSVPAGLHTLPKAYLLESGMLLDSPSSERGQEHQLTVEFFTSAYPDTNQDFNLQLDAHQIIDETESNYLPLPTAMYEDKVRAIIGEEAGIQALSDNWLIARYRASNTEHASYVEDGGWSQWTEPAFAQGWIKRVLAGINPFAQRVTDLFNNRIDSNVSILTQAGARWEGDVALNLESINDYGLIEIYETVLRTGKKLSINAGKNYGPANDALLSVAGYLNDLYSMLGNEAWADAANPTIGIGTKDNTYGDVATALFAFKGQLPTLLDEELALLRGRDDTLVPGVEESPVYNRLFWNYTRGIDSGEVIYALNYNIQEDNDGEINGAIDADDARKMFPQGHGDAYGHYLTALKGYYSLLLNNDFDWVPRIEQVNILEKPVAVDYQDERKFASTAVAVARTGKQIVDLTWRKDFQPNSSDGWEHLSKSAENGKRTRYWGVDHWASRTGQGAYLNWVMGNAILPDKDPDPSHEGIQKVDRTTVPELIDLVYTLDDLQVGMDNAEAHLSPLGMPKDSIAFDLNPQEVAGHDGHTHFEQTLERAMGALNNAVVSFDDTKDMTRLMRSEQDSLAELQTSIDKEELAFTQTLIELYGTPYTDDIGPGKTYAQGYIGPDLLHYSYVDLPETVFPSLWSYQEELEWTLEINDVSDKFVAPAAGSDTAASAFGPDTLDQSTVGLGIDTIGNNIDRILSIVDKSTPSEVGRAMSSLLNSSGFNRGMTNIVFNIGPHGFHSKPSDWRGKRSSPGELQQAASEVITAHIELRQAINDAVGGMNDFHASYHFLNAKNIISDYSRSEQRRLLEVDQSLKYARKAQTIANKIIETAKEKLTEIAEGSAEALPTSFVVGTSNGTDPTAPGRGAIKTAAVVAKGALSATQFLNEKALTYLERKHEKDKIWVDFGTIQGGEYALDRHDEYFDLSNELSESQGLLWTINYKTRALDDARRRYRSLKAKGERIQTEREIFRQRSAALVQGFRTRDVAFRVFRDEKLERYKTLFDLAAQYAYLAANAYDYETGLLNTERGRAFVSRILQSRALGVVKDGQPHFAGSNTGDPGLSSALAEMKADFEVLKGRLGFNNPDGYGTTFSLRTEKERIIPGVEGDASWRDVMSRGRKNNLLDDADVRRYCMQLQRGNNLPVPGIVIEFETTIADGLNFFGKPLAGGDHYFPTSTFATKIHAVGVAFEGYIGMDNPVANTSVIHGTGGTSPADPSAPWLGSRTLAATPGIYLIPTGVDSMRSPPLGDSSRIRSWNVKDIAIPLPFNIGDSDFSSKTLWQSRESLTEPLFALRKHHEFRPVSTAAAFSTDIHGPLGSFSSSQYTSNRLIGRSVWNSKWKLVIPGHKLLGDPLEGLDRFIETVKDIKLHFVTYSYAGN